MGDRTIIRIPSFMGAKLLGQLGLLILAVAVIAAGPAVDTVFDVAPIRLTAAAFAFISVCSESARRRVRLFICQFSKERLPDSPYELGC